ncbi:MAG: alanine--tRNA ligase [Chitinivibrionales bacterium]|nr:alanine--tRNA ligase [Chitinivibrionales bacterium]
MSQSAVIIRQEFIDFFKKRGHKFVPSSPVIPQDDPTLLFTNAGMNQFKAIFLGENRDGLRRVANSQKCMRVSGKHNDLEEVGTDHYHHTFFEMLGNWSFGDYYKKEAIAWAWELMTDVWKLSKQQLYATVFTDDDESFSLWSTVTDIDHSHISRHGAKDNFWEMGEVGPCGPCSEIHLDTGRCTSSHPHTCGVNVSGCTRFLELWNLVFIQFNREKDGKLTELPSKSVDTGMGLERIVRILQNVHSNYDTDLFSSIIAEIERLCGRKYAPDNAGTPFRVIADHIRSLVFSITDGGLPSNDGRGYVIRRLLRRAYRFGRKLGFTQPFLHRLVPTVASVMAGAFPEIAKRQDYVSQVIRSEEERFDTTLETGLEKINALIEKAKKAGIRQLSGDEVFLLYDTYGFPMDLTRLIASEQSLSVDEVGFEQAMQTQRQRCRDVQKAGSSDGLTAEGWVELKPCHGTEFIGYDRTEAAVAVCRYKLVQPQDAKTQCMELLLVLDTTPFYAEMGGQVGDQGQLVLSDGSILPVLDTIKWNDMTIHRARVPSDFSIDLLSQSMTGMVNLQQRLQTQRNHSATHLLQAALRQVLGNHVNQSGSKVWPAGLRFDFTHFKALTKEEIEAVENRVNEWILQDITVSHVSTSVDEAKKSGAIALFGEKYGETVRVVSIGQASKELCGGTHVTSTGTIGLFHIVSEESIASGVRRIEAITGTQSVSYLRSVETVVGQASALLKVSKDQIPQRITDLIERGREVESKLTTLSKQIVGQEASTIITIMLGRSAGKSFPFLVKYLGSVEPDAFNPLFDSLCDAMRRPDAASAVVFIAAVVQGKALFAACAGADAVKKHGIHCGQLVKAAAQVAGGGGGGSPTRAQAGGKDGSKVTIAVQQVEKMLNEKAGRV